MDDNQILAELAANLIEASARNGASYITEKIRTIKAKKDDKKLLQNLKK